MKNKIQVAIVRSWTPSKQREEDWVIMDVVCHQMSQWVWEGVNQHRLYLQATTIADLTTIDGNYIPIEVQQVRAPIRENKIRFPFQAKPGKEDIKQWGFFIDSISSNGHK